MNLSDYSGYLASAFTGLSVAIIGLIVIHFSEKKAHRKTAAKEDSMPE